MATTTKKGWGIGYLDNNVGGGFNNFTDPTALQNEISRMDTVMKNRSAQKLGNTAQQNYYNQLKSYAPVNPDQYRTQSATISDISSKYGFDFSRDYAKRQAEAEAQAKRNAVADAQRKNQSNKEINLKSIDNNVMSAAEGLDRNYFQQYQQQQQAQVNGGINGGIAADQDLRMSMARQAAMGDVYRDANLGRMQENSRFTNDDLRLAEELGLINQSALAREDSLFNERLMQGAGLAMDTDRFNLSQNQMLLDAAMRNRSENLSAAQNSRDYARSVLESDRGYNRGVLESDRDFNQRKTEWSKEFERMLGRDKRSDFESDRGYNRGVFESDRNYGLDNARLGLDRQRLANDKALAEQEIAAILQGLQGNQQGLDYLQQFEEEWAAKNELPIDTYYKTQDQIMRPIPRKSPVLPHVPPARNATLTDWDRMKQFGITSKSTDFSKTFNPFGW